MNNTAAVFPEGSLISLPRPDGAVQVAAWNAYADDPANKVPAWADRWFFLQDTVAQFGDILTARQAANISGNVSQARVWMSARSTSTPTVLKGQFYRPAYDRAINSAGRAINTGVVIADASSFAHDFQAPGREFVPGTWAADLTPDLFAQWKAAGSWPGNPPATPFQNLPGYG